MSYAATETDPRFPIGKFNFDDYAERAENIETLALLPDRIASAVEGLSDEQLDTPYREGGWTIRQVVHHVADSHMNTLCRFKLALTEDEAPTIRPYYEDRWAELADSKLPIDVSLGIIRGLHIRLVELLRNMTDADLAKEFIHPETGPWTLEKAAGLYAWHSLHHTAHITRTRAQHGW